MSNTLAHGATIAQRYEGLGGFTGTMRSPLHKQFGLIFGFAGAGKSYLLEDVPDSFTINTDISDTANPAPRTSMWPGKDSVTGRALGDSGPIVLTQELIQGKVDVLKKLAAENKPRPATIIFNSVTSWQQIINDFILRNAVGIGLARTTVSELNQLNGPARYGYLYDLILRTVVDLKSAGYGVILVAHVVKDRVPIGPDQVSHELKFTMGDGMWSRLHPLIEYSLYVGSQVEARNVKKVREVKFRDKTIQEEYTTSVEERQWYVFGEFNKLEGMLKSRVPFQRINIPRESPWDFVQSEYVKLQP